MEDGAEVPSITQPRNKPSNLTIPVSPNSLPLWKVSKNPSRSNLPVSTPSNNEPTQNTHPLTNSHQLQHLMAVPLTPQINGLNFQPHPLKHPIQQHPPTLPSQNLLPNHLPHLHHIHLVPQHMSLLPNQNLPMTPLTHLQAQAWLPSSATSNRRNANEPTVTKRNHPNPPPTHNHLQQPPQDTAKLQLT